MVFDLKAQKLVYGGNGVGIFRRDADAGAPPGVFQLVLNGVAEFLHGLRTWRILRVNQHGGGKIAGYEHFCDVAEVHADFIAGCGVAGGVGLDIDRAAVGIQNEMMSGFVMGEAHDVIATVDDALVMAVLRGRFVLGIDVQGSEHQEGCGYRRVHTGNPFGREYAWLDG